MSLLQHARCQPVEMPCLRVCGVTKTLSAVRLRLVVHEEHPRETLSAVCLRLVVHEEHPRETPSAVRLGLVVHEEHA